jgi:glutamate N-acetyltransferase/amino-acid N-acetyltransferase
MTPFFTPLGRRPGHVAARRRAAGRLSRLRRGVRHQAVGGPDLGLLVSSAPQTTSAARFTRSGVLAAPVVTCRSAATSPPCRDRGQLGQRQRRDGRAGLDEAARMQGAGAMVAGTSRARVGVASTGVIGVQLDGQKIVTGLVQARDALAPDGDAAFADAIRTTDAYAKRASLDVELPSGRSSWPPRPRARA